MGVRALALWLALVAVACAGSPTILARYASFDGANGLRRLRPHAGVDLAAAAGTPVLAPADGEVESVEFSPGGCGLSLLIHHADFSRYSAFCHLSRLDVKRGDWVKRGQKVGAVGDTGSTGGFPHLHWQLCRAPCPTGTADGNLVGTEDPMARYVGCFKPGRRNEERPLVFTSPLPCAR